MSLTKTLDSALQQIGAKPAITWYDQQGRLELSGAVLRNWIIKSTNMAIEELELESDQLALLDLPLHWRTLIWTAAIWHTGAGVEFTASPDGVRTPVPEVIISAAPARHTGLPATTLLAAQSMGALDRAFSGQLPPGALDATAQVRGFADQYGYLPEVDGAALALISPQLRYDQLLSYPLPSLPATAQRLAVDVAEQAATTAPLTALALLRALAAGHSLVVFAEPRTAQDRQRLAEVELVDAVFDL